MISLRLKQILLRTIDGLVTPMGWRIVKAHRDSQNRAEGFLDYLEEANKNGMDVNDWIEEILGWGHALPILKQVVFPHLRTNQVVCEIGVGTGRHARQFLAHMDAGTLHLVDHSPWICDFLNNYFSYDERVHIHLIDHELIPIQDGQVDLIFSGGTFIELKLSQIYLFSREFFRILAPGGVCIFDYLDPLTSEGWAHLKRNAATQYF